MTVTRFLIASIIGGSIVWGFAIYGAVVMFGGGQ